LHFNAQRTFVRLAEHYRGNDAVAISAIRNPWTPENPASPTGIALHTLAKGGKRHYTSVEELYAVQDQVLGNFLAHPSRLTEALQRALGIA